MGVTKYLALPREMTAFERGYLAHLNKIALVFFYLHIPALMVVAWAAGTGPLYALGLSLFVMIGPTIAYRTIEHPRSLSIVYGVTAMLMGGLLVHFGQGPVQIEMHFYFFALLAMLCMFANPMVNMAAAVTVALHHLVVWLIAPRSVFNYEAQWWVVLVHAAFVVLETVAACYISRQFFDNVIGLEKIVAARTETIREKQRDMRLILDHVETGLVTIDLAGRMSSECSRVVEQWFGAPAPGQTLAAWLGRKDATYGEWLALGLESLAEGTLPPDVALGQLPTVLKDGDRTYAVAFQLITGPADVPEKILVIVADMTERLRKEASERYQVELLELFQHIMRDKAGFVEFLAEADGLMETLERGAWTGDDELKRVVHTLKGNCAIFGMRRLSEMCHRIEIAVADNGAGAIDGELAELQIAWRQVRADLGNLL
ncbi:MAG TPA: Hpt domain-containing protein, partial [Terriglobales bacterium]|nr:Hpt domain-containing protein [Terriglobales bacterium]